MRERRKHFLINKSLQFRYMIYISATLFVVSIAIMISLYFGIWGGVLDAFSNDQIRNDLLTASRMVEYEKARITSQEKPSPSLSFFKQAEKLSNHQREAFKNILDETNRKLLKRFLFLLILIAWASIYITHKIAGPLYRIHTVLGELGRGNLTVRARLRKSDQVQSLASQFNQAAEFLDHFFCRLKNILRENKNDSRRLHERMEDELSKIKSSVDTQ